MHKRLAGDALFLFQLGFALVFGIGQFVQLLSSSQGVSVSWFGAWQVFLLLNLWLAWHAHKAAPSRISVQVLTIYIALSVMVTANLAVMFVRGTGVWTELDTLTAVLAAIGVFTTLVIGKFDLSNPLVKGWLAVFFKAAPQVILAWSIWRYGGEGVSWIAVIAGHVMILTRLGQLYFSVREAGWDKNRIGLLISEGSNELSWILATGVWMVR